MNQELLESLEKYIEVRERPKIDENGNKINLIDEMRAFSHLKEKLLEYKNGSSYTHTIN